jgi:hypothetical protein
MGHRELSGPLGAVPADDFAGAERCVGGVHVAAELALVPVIAVRLGEPAFDPSAEGLSHWFLLLSVRYDLGNLLRSGPAVDAESGGGRSGSEVKGHSEKKIGIRGVNWLGLNADFVFGP